MWQWLTNSATFVWQNPAFSWTMEPTIKDDPKWRWTMSWHSSTAGSKLNAIQYEKSCPPECRDPDSFVTCFSPAEVLWPVVYVSTFFNRSYMKLVVANGTNPRSNMCHWSNNNSCESRIIGGHYITIWISFFWSHVYPTIHFWASLNPVQESSSCFNENGRKKGFPKNNLAHMV